MPPETTSSPKPEQLSTIDVTIGNHKYVLRSEESEEHLREVAEMVRKKVDSLKKQNPALTLQKATMLAALDFASQSIKGRKRALDYKGSLLNKAQQLIDKVQSEVLNAKPGVQ